MTKEEFEKEIQALRREVEKHRQAFHQSVGALQFAEWANAQFFKDEVDDSSTQRTDGE